MSGNLSTAPGIQANTLECSYYYIVAAGTPNVDVPYSSMVPSGETRPLRIYDGFLSVDTLIGGASHSLLVESPASSQLWKFPLGWLFANDGKYKDKMNMSQPVTLSSGDSLCFHTWNASTYSGGKFMIHYIIGP